MTTASDLDCSSIARRLWVGAQPPFDRHLPEFDTLVLCAKEIQPAVVAFRGHLLRCPLPDDALSKDELTRALIVGKQVGEALVRRETVLVTCHMGWNRSALVAGLALGLVTYLSAEQIIALIRARRSSDCLGNKHFRMILHRYIGAGRRPKAKPPVGG